MATLKDPIEYINGTWYQLDWNDGWTMHESLQLSQPSLFNLGTKEEPYLSIEDAIHLKAEKSSTSETTAEEKESDDLSEDLPMSDLSQVQTVEQVAEELEGLNLIPKLEYMTTHTYEAQITRTLTPQVSATTEATGSGSASTYAMGVGTYSTMATLRLLE